MRDREREIRAILRFVSDHPQSYASLAVCRRAIDAGIGEVTKPIIQQLAQHLAEAPDEEIAAYYSIVM